MDVLRKADRQVVWWAIAAWILLCLIGLFWAMHGVDDELDAQAERVASFEAAEGAAIEFNGRDGYLEVPAGTENAEQIASDIADRRGVRDVEIEFVGTAEPTATTEPAAFDVDWNDVGVDGSGTVPDGTADDFNALFGIDGLTDDPDRDLSPEVDAALRDRIAPLIGAELPEGSLSVADNRITLTGIADDQATANQIGSDLGDLGFVTTNLSVAEAAVEATPAVFDVSWSDGGEPTQSGAAPTELEADVAGLGVATPTVAPDLVFGDNVGAALGAVTPLVGTDLVTGSVSVDNDVVTIEGTAPDQDAFDRATAALADVDASVNLTLAEGDQAESAQSAIDDLLALDKIEFVTGTAVPTEATEAIIDQVAETLTEFPEVNISITGHTDSRGGDAANQALSEQRAQAVLDGLVARGIAPERLQASGKGETEPIDTNETAEGQQRNRRVEIDVEENG